MTMEPKDAGSPMGIAVLRADESLCMAIFVNLERLTPGERAVFLLRRIFGYQIRRDSDDA
ncbi:MAG: hypothetical protein ABSD75_32245 [Terriglobales bacterium]|jgi:DNA-directed RNA polymerase specialized sigma24 family protein